MVVLTVSTSKPASWPRLASIRQPASASNPFRSRSMLRLIAMNSTEATLASPMRTPVSQPPLTSEKGPVLMSVPPTGSPTKMRSPTMKKRVSLPYRLALDSPSKVPIYPGCAPRLFSVCGGAQRIFLLIRVRLKARPRERTIALGKA